MDGQGNAHLALGESWHKFWPPKSPLYPIQNGSKEPRVTARLDQHLGEGVDEAASQKGMPPSFSVRLHKPRVKAKLGLRVNRPTPTPKCPGFPGIRGAQPVANTSPSAGLRG